MNRRSASSSRRRLRHLALAAAAVLLAGCGGGGDDPAVARDDSDPWFTDITASSGLDHRYFTGAIGELHMPESVSGGCALFDADGDGDLDVYLANGNRLLPDMAVAAEPRNALYLQQEGGRFVDATESSGLGDGGYGMGVGVGDVDNDGDLDVYVANYGPDRLYANSGGGTFEDVTSRAGVAVHGWSSSVAFLDFDRDGWLDLFVTRYIAYDPSRDCHDGAGRIDYCGPTGFEPMTDVLLRGLGGGVFEDVSERAGITAAAGAGLGVIASDLDGDGWADLYVANDGWDNHLWMNGHDGTFENTALERGAAYNMQGRAEAGMGLVADDLDGDGHEDLFITHLTGETNTLLRHLNGRAVFDDWTGRSRLGGPSTPYTGFGVVALDLEHDADLDLIVANGGVRRGAPHPDADPTSGTWAELAQPNQLFRNDGAGSFEPFDPPAGGLLTGVEVSRGLAMGDIDADGDLDLLLTNLEGPARLFRNDVPREGHWLQVRAVLPELGRDAIGARITVHAGRHVLTRTVRSGTSYQSVSQLAVHFGLGSASVVDRVDVRWPDGTHEWFPGGPVDRRLTIRQGDGKAGS